MQTTKTSWNYLDDMARASIEELMDGDPELISDLVNTLIASSPDLLKEIEVGIKTGNATQIREAAHALKSSNAQLGALSFSELCAEMEKRGRSGEISDIETLYEKIMEEFERVASALESWKEHLTSQ
ncbi:MAG: Hpt domain-containing protein [Bacteroidia bacterium]|nr:Hpt domain-containing protein [Bacteroidia bacterium]